MRRDIVWERTGPMGLEHLVLETGDTGIRADGLLVMDFAGDVVRVRYAIELGPDWRTHAVGLRLDRGGAVAEVRAVRAGEDWSVDGAPRPDLAGAFDIDIKGTPFTNAMPLRRLALRPGAPERIRVAYFDLPSLAVRPAEQEYARFGPDRFRYRSLDTGFEAAITADADGIVVDYPPIWRRR